MKGKRVTDAPEKIWVQPRTCTVDASGASRLLAMDREFAGGTQYTRTDTALAMVAAEREACAETAEHRGLIYQIVIQTVCQDIAQRIRARTPADAQAALERVKREARNKALREAARNLRTYAPHLEDGPEHDVGYYHGYQTALNRILAQMEDTDDE